MKYLKILLGLLVFNNIGFTTNYNHEIEYEVKKNIYKVIYLPINIYSNVTKEFYYENESLYYSYGDHNVTQENKDSDYYYAPLFYKVNNSGKKGIMNQRNYYKRVKVIKENTDKQN